MWCLTALSISLGKKRLWARRRRVIVTAVLQNTKGQGERHVSGSSVPFLTRGPMLGQAYGVAAGMVQLWSSPL